MKDLSRIRTGKKGEAIAASYLERAGYRIIERNYRCLFGEIDIVARQGGALVFVEVKSRKSTRFGEPEAAVGRKKQKKMSCIALHYLKDRHLPLSCNARFDVVAIKLLSTGDEIEHIQSAFDLVL